jgi:hypothetical protein
MLNMLRSGSWLSPARARAYRNILAAIFLIALPLIWLFHVAGLPIPGLPPQGRAPMDYVTFWSAAHLAASAAPNAPYYDIPSLAAHESQAVILTPGQFESFFYPPPYLLLILPLALFPYLPGYAVFVASQIALLAISLRRLWPRGLHPITLIAFPPFFINSFVGQNGTLSAVLYLAAASMIDRTPYLAGAALGVFAGKPQLALAVPVALLFAGRFRALAGAALSATALCAGATAVFGWQVWTGYIRISAAIREAMVSHADDWWRYLSVQSLVRNWGGGFVLATTLQTATALATLLFVARVARRRPDGKHLVALAAAGSLLCTPHLSDYDLMVMTLPLIVLYKDATAQGFRPWEKTIAALLFVLPLMARDLAHNAIPVMPPLMLALLLFLASRSTAATPTAKPAN